MTQRDPDPLAPRGASPEDPTHPTPQAANDGDALLLVLTNVPDAAAADRIARAVVDERLAACVNALAPIRSTYRWQGRVECADEIPLLIKTTPARWPALAARLRALHSHDVPEIVAWRADAVDAPYLAWVVAETSGPPGDSS